MWDFGDYNFDIYNTEIARRGSLLAQDIGRRGRGQRSVCLPHREAGHHEPWWPG